MTLPIGEIICGDSLEVMRQWPDACVDCCVTSPPYWGLRDYGVDGQLGLERTPQEYIAAMVAVFEEVRRVLKPTGTLWLNVGDSYAGSWGNYHPTGKGGQRDKETERFDRKAYQSKDFLPPTSQVPGLKPKDLCMIPARLALALQEAGWWLRSDIIWAKPNPMPESVTDRPTSAHEHIFLLAKSARYYYDAEAAREPGAESEKGNRKTFRGGGVYTGGASFDNSVDKSNDSIGNAPVRRIKMPDGWNTGPGAHGSFHPDGCEKGKTHVITGKGGRNAFRGQGAHRDGENGPANREGRDMQDIGAGLTRNSRNVWTIATRPFKEAHFATFPPELPRRCILAGCPPGGIVLDPFMGSGTVGMVAQQISRNFIGIELNPEYAAMARKRTAQKGLPLE